MNNRFTPGLLTLTLILIASLNIRAQKPAMKYGDVTKEELMATRCPIDSNAHAYYIYDYGKTHFEYGTTRVVSDRPDSENKGFQLYFTRQFRIKIIDNQGFSWADVEIPLYHDDDEERTTGVKAATYNLENGKIVRTKLNASDIILEETSENWMTKKFALPNVRAGSVIEVEYSIKSDYFFNLRDFGFQHSIPVLQSDYHVRIPDYFIYNATQRGYYPIKVEKTQQNKQLEITYVQVNDGMIRTTDTYSKKYDYMELYDHYHAENIPAFPSEGFLRTVDNYLSRVEFELAYTKFPNQSTKSYTTSWAQVDDKLLDNYNFGKQLDKSGHFKRKVEAMKSLNLDDDQLMNMAFHHIKKTMVWNGVRSKYTTDPLGKTYKDGGGNCADINLNLVVLLKELGLSAYPVVLSTQENGIIHPAHPSMSRFNYVIAMVQIDSSIYLMDATDPTSEINLIPVRCLNDKGRVIDPNKHDWINLMEYKSFQLTTKVDLSFDENFVLSGTEEMLLKDYAAYNFIKDFKKYNTKEEYTQSLEKKNAGFSVEKMELSDLDSITESVNVSYQIKIENPTEISDDLLYFSPVLDPFIEANPFKLPKRDYPVEYNFPYRIQQIYTIDLPENYEVAELPETIVLKLPDNGIKFIYQVNVLGNKINLVSRFLINKSIFLPDEYEALKQIYDLMLNKQKEMIVLKKI